MNTVQIYLTKPELEVQRSVKRLIYLGCWRMKKMEMFSMRVRNTSKHKFVATKVTGRF